MRTVAPPRADPGLRSGLAPFVERVWHYESDHPHVEEVVLPTGRMQLIVDLRAGSAIVVGASTRPRTIETRSMRHLVGIAFKPGGASRFFSQPCIELSDQSVPLEALWKCEAPRLLEQLVEAQSSAVRLALLQASLVHQAQSHQPARGIETALGWLDAGASVAEVLARTGWSRSHFMRTFAAQVGTTPKSYAGVGRFQRAVRHLNREPRQSLVQIAAACGYYDQAHFNHDFRRFAGRSPTAYHPRQRDEPNHIAI